MIWRYHPEAAEEFLEACIHYSLVDEDNVVLVVAVMDMRRQPGYWRHRLS